MAEGSLSSPSASSTSEPDSAPTKKLPKGEYLEDLSRTILDISLNEKDCSNPFILKHMAPSFRGKHDALPKTQGRDGHQENLAKHLAAQPDFHCNILNTSSDVDDNRGRATVYLWYEITGLAQGLEREAVAVLSWERKQGLWLLMKHTGMRGPSGFS